MQDVHALLNARDAFSPSTSVMLMRAGAGYAEYLPGDADRPSRWGGAVQLRWKSIAKGRSTNKYIPDRWWC